MRIPVDADGQTFEELHVDGGVSSETFFAPPQVGLGRLEEQVQGRQRQRILYVIRNGKLGTEYAVTPERTLDVATRSIATLITYQGLTDLLRFDRAARHNHVRMAFNAIPARFDVVPKTPFDTVYMRKLYAVGEAIGRAGSWQKRPPETPGLAP